MWCDRRVSKQPEILPLAMSVANDTADREPPFHIPCHVCRHEIPLSAAVWREASDYVEHFCGLDCYDRWRKQSRDL